MLSEAYRQNTTPIIVEVLGARYDLYLDVPKCADKTLETCDAYCDKTTRTIVCVDAVNSDLEDFARYRKQLIRHELIHAFLFESGISGCTTWDIPGEEHPEHMVEWIAMQFPKMFEAFSAVGAMRKAVM